MSQSIKSLDDQIEALVREHVEATRRAATAAVERAFAAATASPSSRARRSVPATKRAGSSRRSPLELAALGERLHEAVRAQPGERMSVLAGALGVSPRALHRPMTALKRAGRLRSVGQRHLTRYYPAVAATTPD